MKKRKGLDEKKPLRTRRGGEKQKGENLEDCWESVEGGGGLLKKSERTTV